MTDAFRDVNVGNLGEIGEDAKNQAQFVYDKAEKKFRTGKDIEGGIGSLKAMVSGKKLSEAIGDRIKPIIKRKVGDEYRAFKDAWQRKAQNGIEKVLKPKATSEATEATETEGNLTPDLGSVASKAENVLAKTQSIQSKLTKINRTGRESRAVNKEAQADKLEEETEKTEQLAKEAGFKNATTDDDIPLAMRQATKAKYAKMGKLRQDAKDLRKQNEAEANEEETNLNESQPVSSQAQSQVPKPNADGSADADASALGKAQIKSGEDSTAPDNTPSTGPKKGGEEEEGAEEGAEEGGEEAGEGILEGIGGALADTGILAPLGLLLGAVGIGLGARKKGEPVEKAVLPTQNNYSFQAGIN